MSMRDLHFSAATPAEAKLVREFTRAAYFRWVAILGREPQPMGADYEAALRAHRIDLAYRGGELVGLIEMAPALDHLFIVNAAVAPAHQGRGLGPVLMDHGEQVAREMGFGEVRLYTNKLMAANVRLYLRLGYRIDREEKTDVSIAVHMSKALVPEASTPKLLFLPGAGASARFWRPVAERLPGARERRFLSWPGLGDEPARPAVGGLDDLVGLTLTEMDGPCDLIAQSMGGLVAIKAALAAPERVRRLVLTATSGGVPVRELGGEEWRDNYRRNYPRAAAWITEAREDLSAQIGAIGAPALLIWGDADPISPVAVGERLTALLPNARLRIIRGGGHDLARTHAAEVAALIAAHLGL